LTDARLYQAVTTALIVAEAEGRTYQEVVEAVVAAQESEAVTYQQVAEVLIYLLGVEPNWARVAHLSTEAMVFDQAASAEVYELSTEATITPDADAQLYAFLAEVLVVDEVAPAAPRVLCVVHT
jgi:hypothetical protein